MNWRLSQENAGWISVWVHILTLAGAKVICGRSEDPGAPGLHCAQQRLKWLDGFMACSLKYVIFRTRLGWFGLLGGERGLLRTSLPVGSRDKAKSVLLKGIGAATCERRLFSGLQEKIKAYFEADCVDFADACVELPRTNFASKVNAGFGPHQKVGCGLKISEFSEKVLITCRGVEYGRTVSYGQLARLAGRPGAGQAVGNVLSRNPVPLIIPCHRVIRSDGKIGGFSAAGGIKLKQKMLELERQF